MYQQPKIFLIDTHETVHNALLKNWANIGIGTLGIPYKVPAASSWLPVIQNRALRKFEESDLIIIDLASTGIAEKASGGKHAPEEEVDLWAKCDKGWIDARARTILLAKKDFNRIVMSGGILIVYPRHKPHLAKNEDLVY